MPSPTPPPDMARDDEAGAIAAAVYFLTELYPYTVNSKDTDAWLAMSHPDCIFCASTVDTVEGLKLSGERAAIAPIRITSQSSEGIDPVRFGVFLAIETGPDRRFGADGSLTGEVPITYGKASIAITRQAGIWLVRGIELVPVESRPT